MLSNWDQRKKTATYNCENIALVCFKPPPVSINNRESSRWNLRRISKDGISENQATIRRIQLTKAVHKKRKSSDLIK